MTADLICRGIQSTNRLDGHNQLPKLVLGVTFNDGIEVIANRLTASPQPPPPDRPGRHQNLAKAPEMNLMMTKMLTPDDVRDLLIGFAAVIELDQIRTDALPSQKCHPLYDDSMWLAWRRDHLDYINQLLPTVEAIPSAMLGELTRVAITFPSAVVQRTMVSLFADALMEEFETAELFFGWLIKEVSAKSKGEPLDGDARTLVLRWISVTDPLRIAEDPECGYGRPAGFVN